jgi:hypothetical protein
MNKEFTEKLTKCVADCKKIVVEVKRKQDEQRKIMEELAKKKAEELKLKKLTDIIGDLNTKLVAAANKGLNWVDIDLPEKDFQYGAKLADNTGSIDAYKYLKDIEGLSVEVKSRQEEERGSYGEREVWTVYYLRITF